LSLILFSLKIDLSFAFTITLHFMYHIYILWGVWLVYIMWCTRTVHLGGLTDCTNVMGNVVVCVYTCSVHM
jgi:hypothetical protein